MKRNTSSSISRSHILRSGRLLVAVVILLGLVEILFLGDNPNVAGPSPRQPGQAAVATQLPANNGLALTLPNTKEEARAFTRQHESLFNFDEVNRLRSAREIALGNAPAQAALTPAITPAPTPHPNSNPAQANGVVRAAATCSTTVYANDSFEPDNAYTQASTLVPALAPYAPAQFHTLTSIGTSQPGQGDVDWAKFQITGAAAGPIYTIETTALSPNGVSKGDGGVDTVMELYRWNTNGAFPANPIAFSDDVGSNADSTSPLRSRIVYTAVTGDDAANIFFFVRIYGAPNNSCPGSYNLTANYTIPNTPTPTGTATATVATATVSPTPDPCRDTYEDDSNPTIAKELRVTYGATPPFGGQPGQPDNSGPNSNVQVHIICPTGDIDWVYVDLVKGKPYSIFTSNLSSGLDTIVILFDKDAQGNFVPVYSNDDFPGMGVASRIDFVVPAPANTPTGDFKRYYVAIKDVSNHGTPGMGYNLTLTSPGSPKNDCIDSYEPDGLQYLSKEILINEGQNHVLCPDGDADWVKFFAKAGRTYTLKVQFSPTAGMDTTLGVYAVTFDPNDPTSVISQSQIGFNDDLSVTDLSSQVDFSVPSDGLYYAQVKNNGGVGRPGFNYQLTFTTGGAAVVPPTAVVTPSGPTPTGTATANATATLAANRTATVLASIGPTKTPTPSPTTGTGAAALEGQKFADPSFQHLWDYSDRAVFQNQAQRSWEWGPKPGVVRLEPYSEAPDGARQVQYFDKSRMEINNPKGERTSPWFVTNGLLVREMITGHLTKGDRTYETRPPARLQLAGDTTPNNPAPTYAQFGPLILASATDQTGQTVRQGLDAGGGVVSLSAPPESLKLALWVKETGHNVPQVFYDYMQSKGTVYDNGFKQGVLRDWVFSMGYPLSEPYWIKARVGGVEKDVLVQVFERRVLTYTPSNSPDWRVEMANVGQHYYLWRYNQNLNDQ